VGVQLDHTIVRCRDKRRSAKFFTEVMGLPEAVPFGPFLVVALGNQVSLDFHDQAGDVAPQHYAFLVGESDFAEIYARIRQRELAHWADPARQRSGEINHRHGGRGVYFEDPDGHFLEIMTRRYDEAG
jgi:catechol 2,3-dioxygenase-like lactoylglutathione lyase family enzyme